ncbi:MAG TPA: glycosyltransferase, partial [Steroidobacter sp.]|nr:glycosyltransferase [Steroidobacter sp.]
MSNENISRLRVLHLVSAVGAPGALQQLLFMPLLTRIPKERVQAQVVCLSPGAVPAAVLRQNGVPVHEVALSRKRFSMGGLAEVLSEARRFHPDVIQAWGHTAQIVSTRVRARCAWRPKLVWAVAETTPLARDAGFLDRQKLKFAARLAAKTDCIVYTSEAGAGQHRRVGFPEEGHRTIPPGVDAARFKPDPAVRRKVREQLKLAPNAFVIGMAAPFQPEFDHATLIKAAAELSKTHRETALVLAGYGVQPGNAALMALIGGALSSHTHLLGEWSDVGSLFNACDVVCSSALTDRSRMTLVMAMLCGVPCVATGMGAQGEVLGRFGVAVETGSPAAFVRGITRIMQLTPERRAQMIHGARTHAMNDYVYVQSLQKYLQLYSDLIGREPAGASDPEPADSALPQAPAPPSGNKLDTLAVEPPGAALASPATQPDVPPSDSAPVLQRD